MGYFGGGGASGAGLDPSLFLPRSGGTMLGPLVLAGDPALPLAAATRQYVDNEIQDLQNSIQISLAAPAEFLVSGSPADFDGTLTLAWEDQAANMVFAGPASGTDDVPSFRALVAADVSDLSTTLGDYLPLTGGTITGPLTLEDNLQVDTDAAIDGDLDVGGEYLLNGQPLIPQAQSPWIQNIDANGFGLFDDDHLMFGTGAPTVERMRIHENGWVSIGNDLSVPPWSGAGGNPLHLMVGSITDDVTGRLMLCSDITSGPNAVVGGISYCNYATTLADKRIVSLQGMTGSTEDAGQFRIYVRPPGAASARLQFTITEDGIVGFGNDATRSGGNAQGWVNIGPNNAAGEGYHGRLGLSTYNSAPATNSHIGGIQWGNYGLPDDVWSTGDAPGGDNKRVAGLYCYSGSGMASSNMTFWTRNVRDPEDPDNPGNPVINYPASPPDIVRRMIITQRGWVGIGNSADGTALYPDEIVEYEETIPGDPTSIPPPRVLPKIHLAIGGDGSLSPAALRLPAGIGELTLGSRVQSQSDAKLGAINFNAMGSSSPDHRYTTIESFRENVSHSGYMVFKTRQNQTTFVTERMRINSYGYVGIANDATPPNLPTDPARVNLTVGRTVRVGTPNTGVPAITLARNFDRTISPGIMPDFIGRLQFANYATPDTEPTKVVAMIEGRTYTEYDTGGFAFYTKQTGQLAAERMTIEPNGDVRITGRLYVNNVLVAG